MQAEQRDAALTSVASFATQTQRRAGGQVKDQTKRRVDRTIESANENWERVGARRRAAESAGGVLPEAGAGKHGDGRAVGVFRQLGDTDSSDG